MSAADNVSEARPRPRGRFHVPRWLMVFGMASFGLSMWSFSFITHDWGSDQLFWPEVLRGFPQVFAVAPSVHLGLGSLPPERLKYASGLFNMMRNLGGACGIAALRSTGTTLWMPFHSSYVARAYAELGQFDDAWRCIGRAMTAMQATRERWCEAEAHRVAGEIALKSPQREVAKAQAYFEHSLAVARAQQAKSWELRAATSLGN